MRSFGDEKCEWAVEQETVLPILIYCVCSVFILATDRSVLNTRHHSSCLVFFRAS